MPSVLVGSVWPGRVAPEGARQPGWGDGATDVFHVDWQVAVEHEEAGGELHVDAEGDAVDGRHEGPYVRGLRRLLR